MPFICQHLNKSDYILPNNQKSYTLQVQNYKISLSKRGKWKVSLFASKGSLTIEAAMVVTVFLMTMVSMLYIFVYYQTQVYMQAALEDTVRDITNVSSTLVNDRDKLKDAFTDEYVKDVFWKYAVNKNINNSCIYNGYAGVSFTNTDFISDDGIIDIGIKYGFSFPLGSLNTGQFTVVQHSRRLLFVGIDYAKTDTRQLVYVTTGGVVYHKDRDCTYLKPDVSVVDIDELEEKRNSSGGRYYPCSRCVEENNEIKTVYITPWGSSYHANGNCSSLARIVKTLTKESAEKDGYRACSKCGQ